MHLYPANNPVLQELFDPNLPNSPALWAVLRGNYTGKAVVDDPQNPSQSVLRTDASLTYFSDHTSQAFIDEAISYFRQADPIWLVWPHQTFLRPPFIHLARIVNRLEFFEYDPDSNVLKSLRSQLPEGFTIQKVDEHLLEQCEWRSEIAFYAGSSNNFLLHGIGLCMMSGPNVIVEAYASSLGKTRAEIGAITRQKYRGKGYAPIACAYLVESCKKKGYQAYWSCDADHIASIRVAQKLGFQRQRGYQIYEYNAVL